MLQQMPGTRLELSDRARRRLWALAGVDVMAASWMISAGDWLDRASRVTSVITLGGHHLVVLWLAALGFAILALLAPLTGGFAELNRVHLVALSVAGVVSVVAVAGIVSVAALVAGLALVVALVGGVVIR